jgi:hypothetical protein
VITKCTYLIIYILISLCYAILIISYLSPSESSPTPPASSNVTLEFEPCSSAVTEHRRLFNYAGARPKQSGKGNHKGKKNVSQCSLKFMCMSHCSVEKPPTSVKDRTALSNAGLGDAVISFSSEGDSAHFHGKLLEKFPQLATSGYTLLMYHRGGDESAFCPLKPPYTPKRLKEVAGQCKIYIKPLQKDLIDLNEEDQVSNVEVS